MNIYELIDLTGGAQLALERAQAVFCEASTPYESDLPQDRPGDERHWHRHYSHLHSVSNSLLLRLEEQLEIISDGLTELGAQMKEQGLDCKALGDEAGGNDDVQ